MTEPLQFLLATVILMCGFVLIIMGISGIVQIYKALKRINK